MAKSLQSILKEGRKRSKKIAGFVPPPISDNEASRDEYLFHLSQIRQAERELEPYKKKLKDARNRADAQGVNLKRLDMLKQLTDSRENGKTIREYLESLFREAAWLNLIPWNGQGHLFEQPQSETDEERLNKIFNDGRDVGLSKSIGENPYDETSTEGQVWLAGYNEGHHVNQEMFLLAQEEIAAEGGTNDAE